MKVYAVDLECALGSLPLKPKERQIVTPIFERAPVQDFTNPPPIAGTVHNLVWTFDGNGWSAEMTF